VSGPGHPVSCGIDKMDAISGIRIIEGWDEGYGQYGRTWTNMDNDKNNKCCFRNKYESKTQPRSITNNRKPLKRLKQKLHSNREPLAEARG
jgi:hypothetical protein